MFDRFLSTTKVVYNKVDSFIDNVKSNKVWYSTLWFFVIALSFAILLFLNMLTPLISDDITYLFVFGETDRISSIADVIQSQINHYYMWGGRSVVHFIAQVLLMLPSYVADILNTMMYLVYVSLIYYHIKGKDRKNSLSLFVLINMAIWFFQPVFGDTILWTTGASNYLWGTTIILLFLIPYRIYNGTESKLSLNLVLACTLFVWGVMAGWTNENTAGAMILMVVLFLLYYRSNRWRVPVWGVFGLIGSLIGFSIMILAPGNFERAGGATSLDLYVFAYRLFNYTLTFFYYGGVSVLVASFLFVLYNKFPQAANTRDTNLKITIIYYIVAIAAVYAMLLSPTFPRRALFGVVTFLIIGMGIMYFNLDFKEKLVRQMRLIVMVIGIVSFGFTFYLAAKDIGAFKEIVHERENVIKEAKLKGTKKCEFKRFDGGTYIHGEDPYSEKAMSQYYGIEIELK